MKNLLMVVMAGYAPPARKVLMTDYFVVILVNG